MYNKKYICNKCSYETSKKQNIEKHYGSQNACDKRLKRASVENVSYGGANVGDFGANVGGRGANVGGRGNVCTKCSRQYKRKIDCDRHIIRCKGIDNLQCPTCMKVFSSRFTKHEHIKNVKCEEVIIETEEQKRIKELEDELEKEKEKSKGKIITIINNNNNNNHFNANIQYNDYNKLSTDHISWRRTAATYIRNGRNLPKTFCDIGRYIQNLPENQSIVLPEGQKASYCVVKDRDNESRYPLNIILPKLVSGTATKIGDDLNIAKEEGKLYGAKLEEDLDMLETLMCIDIPDLEGDSEEFKRIRDDYMNAMKHVILSVKDVLSDVSLL